MESYFICVEYQTSEPFCPENILNKTSTVVHITASNFPTWDELLFLTGKDVAVQDAKLNNTGEYVDHVVTAFSKM